ncbi:MAG: serine hydrolase domain-containing protein [Kofleriaceae bacterium]
MKLAWILFIVACGSAVPDPELATAPAGWTVENHVFRDPEHALRVVIAPTDFVDPKLAVAHEWIAAAPELLVRTPELDEPPPTDGWTREVTLDYAMPAPRETRAYFKQFGERGYVILVDGDHNAIAKRDAQIEQLIGSLRPAGMHEEVLAKIHAPEPVMLDDFARQALHDLEVPGAAIGVILDGKVVYERTLGVKKLGEAAPITGDTLFLLASVSKPITTMMEAALVDAGTVTWDTPVTKIMPAFALGDPAITRELKLWHMSCACTGMPREDLEGLFEWSGVTPEQRIALMGTMKPTTKLGETFQYSNPMVAAGGFIAAHAFAPQLSLAEAYTRAMQDKIFTPIGMTSTTLDFHTVETGDHATPHALSFDGETHAMPLAIERAVEPIAPAGAIWSSLHDMERYAMTELADGVAPNGTRVVSIANMHERTRARIATGPTSSYGLGIDSADYHGARLVSHDGGAFGFGTTVYLFPEHHAGIVILTNIRNGNAKAQIPFVEAVRRRIVELMFGGARLVADKQLAYYTSLRHRNVTPPTPPLGSLAGHYHEPVLGDVELRDTPAGPIFDAGEWNTRIAHVGNTLVVIDPPFAGTPIGIGDNTLIVSDGEQLSYTFVRR